MSDMTMLPPGVACLLALRTSVRQTCKQHGRVALEFARRALRSFGNHLL